MHETTEYTEKNNILDYYKVLQCDRSATYEDIKRSYQRLALVLHPDKTGESNDEDFQLLHRAWSVLRDAKSRKEYDATLCCYEHTDCLLYNIINLSDMEYDSIDRVYSYQCRCSGKYYLQNSESLPANLLIGCDECSFSIFVKVR